MSGRAIAVEPAAIVWHRHRPDAETLRTQVIGYGRGLGAALTKLACRPGGFRLLVTRLGPGLRRVMALHRNPAPSGVRRDAAIGALGRLEIVSLLTAPGYYFRSWRKAVPPVVGGPTRWRRRAG